MSERPSRTDDWPVLVAGCLRRERKAQRLVYERYFAFGMGVAIRYTCDRGEAVAVLNNAFLTVFRRLDAYDVRRAFEPWFRTIVVRAALDHLRQSRKHPAHVELDDYTPAFDREETLSRIGYQELLAMVQRLSHAYRMVFNLYVIDGFKHEEIASRLNISVGTSKSNLHKARAQLKRMVEQSLRVNTPASAVSP